MLIRKMIKRIEISNKIEVGSIVMPSIVVDVKPNVGRNQAGEDISFEVCAIASGRNSYLLFNNLLPQGSVLYFKESGKDTMFDNLQDFVRSNLNSNVLMCTLSAERNKSEPKAFVIDFFFGGTVPINMLAMQKIWFTVGEINLVFSSNDEVFPPIEHANETVDSHRDGVITGLFFPNSAFDSVEHILAKYYEIKCSLSDCVIVNDVELRSILDEGGDGKLKKSNFMKYWKQMSLKNSDLYNFCAIAKHDKSPSSGISSEKLFNLEAVENKSIIYRAEESDLIFIE